MSSRRLPFWTIGVLQDYDGQVKLSATDYLEKNNVTMVFEDDVRPEDVLEWLEDFIKGLLDG